MVFPLIPGEARVASLHLHPPVGGQPLIHVPEIQVEAGEGILNNPRYFGRRSANGQATKRQVTLIEREQIAAHACSLEVDLWPPGTVRSNIETQGIRLGDLVGREILIGDAVLFIAAPRDPCSKMDAIAPGLRALMAENRQGVLARVVRSGRIAEGDRIKVLDEPAVQAGKKEGKQYPSQAL